MNNSYWDYIAPSDPDELYHHGIEGQKWGQRNGPPYPLNREQMSPVQRAKNTVSKFASGAANAYRVKKKKWDDEAPARAAKREENKVKREQAAKERAERRALVAEAKAEKRRAMEEAAAKAEHDRLLSLTDVNEIKMHLNELSTDDLNKINNRINAIENLEKHHLATPVDKVFAKADRIESGAKKVNNYWGTALKTAAAIGGAYLLMKNIKNVKSGKDTVDNLMEGLVSGKAGKNVLNAVVDTAKKGTSKSDDLSDLKDGIIEGVAELVKDLKDS